MIFFVSVYKKLVFWIAIQISLSFESKSELFGKLEKYFSTI